MKRLINGILWGSPDGPRIIVNYPNRSFAVLDGPRWFLSWIMRRVTLIDENGQSWPPADTPNE